VATSLFDIAAGELEAGSEMDRLEARGTLRLALKQAGLDVANLTVPQLQAVFEKLMPRELEARGVADATATCDAVMKDIANAASTADLEASNSPDEIFKRLGES
jgi:hypothetical protein